MSFPDLTPPSMYTSHPPSTALTTSGKASNAANVPSSCLHENDEYHYDTNYHHQERNFG